MLLKKGAKLLSHSIYGDYDMDTVVGEVVQNPNNPNLWGIKNEARITGHTYERMDSRFRWLWAEAQLSLKVQSLALAS